MNLAITATVFPLILLGELPDKTMFASLVLASRGRPLAVWLGAAAAFTLHVMIAVTVGVVSSGCCPTGWWTGSWRRCSPPARCTRI